LTLEKLIKLRKHMHPYTRQAMLDLLKQAGIA
jgi:hypothetical protein